LSDLPRCALFKGSATFIEGRSDPSSEEGIITLINISSHFATDQKPTYLNP
jgi:hypothetical protein